MDEEKRITDAVVPQDEEAFAELFHDYYSRIFRYCRANGLSEADAQEVVQATMIAVWKGLKNFQRRAALSTWIFGIAHHKMVDLQRQHNRNAAITAAMRALPKREEKDFSEQITISNRMMQALAKLSEKHRQVILLAFYQGLSCREMSVILASCPMGTVKSRMYHAKERLKELISNE